MSGRTPWLNDIGHTSCAFSLRPRPVWPPWNGPAQAAYAIDVLVQTIADAEQALEGQSIQGQFQAERHQPEWFRVLERGGSGLVECLVLVKLHFITSDIIYRKMR